MPATRDPRSTGAASNYYYRRRLGLRDLLPAIGVGIGVGIGTGVVTYYLARLFLQRTPLEPDGTRRRQARGSAVVAVTHDG